MDCETGGVKKMISENLYINSQGKTVGTIVDSCTVYNNATKQYDTSITVDIEGIGTWTISVNEDLDDDRIKDIAAYKRVCIEGDIEELQRKLTEIDEALVKFGINNGRKLK
ncbi:MAG: hypothetical protein WCR86_11010 [Parabacteroides sp.]